MAAIGSGQVWRRFRTPKVDVRAAAVCAVVALAAPRIASADDKVERALAPSVEYFDGEYAQGYAWLGVGAVALASGAVLYTRDSDIAGGASYPIAAVGLIQVGAGVFSLFVRRKVDAFRERAGEDVIKFVEDERERVDGINTAFVVLEITELSLIVAGAGTAIGGHLSDRDTLTGVGIGVSVQGAAMLALDWFAHRRAKRYDRALRNVHLNLFVNEGGGVLAIGAQF